MITVEHLTKYYGTHLAVDDISFEITEGHVYGFLGPNGAGKSTTMNIITGCLSATDGKVMIDGHDIFEEPDAAKQCIGYLPEHPPLYMNESAEDYLRFVGEAKGLRGMELNAQIREVIEKTGIENVKHRRISQLSKGYKQRVGIAQALLGNPKVIILDEPTVGLDPKQIIEVRNLIRTLAKRHTVLLSTHILAEVKAVCQRVLIIHQGKLIADEETDRLSRMVEDSTHYRYSIIGPQKEVVRLLSSVPGVSDVTVTGERDGEAGVYLVSGASGADCRKAIYYACQKEARPILSAGAVGADLETVFIELVDRAESKTKK